MKAGQLLSIDASNILPEEAIDILARLQSMAEPEDFSTIDLILKEELLEKYGLLSHIDPKSLASASIGQVHKAQINGRQIVLKIQYPDIVDSIDSDLKILKKLTHAFLFPTKKKFDLVNTFAELKFVLELEADYVHELGKLQKYRNYLINDNFFYIPEAFPNFSTKKIIAMEYCEGLSLHDWLKSNPSKEKKQILASKMLDLFLREFLEWGMVQTDPNYGNFLVQQNPFKVILLDFGSTLEYSVEFIKEYLKTLSYAASHGSEETCAQAIEFELLDDRESEVVKKNFYQVMQVSIEPFISSQQPFVFSCSDYDKRSKESVLKFVSSLKYSPPPRKVLFLHRKLGGLFLLLKKMDVELDLTVYWKKMMAKIED